MYGGLFYIFRRVSAAIFRIASKCFPFLDGANCS